MRVTLIARIFPLIMLVTRCGGSSPTEPLDPGSPPAGSSVVVVFGDSLSSGSGLAAPATEAYPALLQARANAAGLPYTIRNSSKGGRTTGEGVAVIDAALVQGTRVLVLALGGGDGRSRVPVPTVKANLATMIQKAKARSITVLLTGWGPPAPADIPYQAEFKAIFPELASEHGIRLIPYWLEGVAGVPRLNQADGVHPNAEGQKVIASTVWTALQPLLAASAAPAPTHSVSAAR